MKKRIYKNLLALTLACSVALSTAPVSSFARDVAAVSESEATTEAPKEKATEVEKKTEVSKDATTVTEKTEASEEKTTAAEKTEARRRLLLLKRQKQRLLKRRLLLKRQRLLRKRLQTQNVLNLTSQ